MQQTVPAFTIRLAPMTPDFMRSLIGGAEERLEAISTRCYKMRTLLCLLGGGKQLSDEMSDVIFFFVEQLDMIESLADGVIQVSAEKVET